VRSLCLSIQHHRFPKMRQHFSAGPSVSRNWTVPPNSHHFGCSQTQKVLLKSICLNRIQGISSSQPSLHHTLPRFTANRTDSYAYVIVHPYTVSQTFSEFDARPQNQPASPNQQQLGLSTLKRTLRENESIWLHCVMTGPRICCFS
jgi:hypothetical protein